MRKITTSFILLSLLLSLLTLTACKGEATQEPHLKIMVGDREIQGIYYGDRYNQSRAELEKRFKMAMEDQTWENLPYVSLNDQLIIKAENFKTEEFEVFDCILTRDGNIRYQENVTQTSVIPVKQGVATFDLASNPAAFLSSNSEDYESGKTIRGFVLKADIEGSSFTFAFILRTDARDTNDYKPEITEESLYKQVNNLEGVSLKTLKTSYPNNLNEIGFVFQNKTDKEYTFGEEYYLEKFENGKWHQLSYAPSVYDPAWNLVGFGLEPNSVRSETLSLEWLYGTSFESGRYRIVKNIIDLKSTGDFDLYYLTAEFDILEQ